MKAFFQCTADLTKEFLQGVPMGSPDSKLLDYWATMSSCLTDLEVSMNPSDKRLLQPAYLNELTRLTRLVFGEDGSLGSNTDQLRYAFQLPELKVLDLEGLWASDLELRCSQLRSLHVECCTIGKLYLQASLEYLHNDFSNPIVLHEGFPVSNLIGLTYLHLEDDDAMEMEAVLFHGLPLMSRLRILSLSIHTCSLPASLPRSLQKFTLGFGIGRGWDSLVIPLVQQLPRVESIRLYPFPSQQSGSFGDKSLDHDLRPFLGMKELKLLQLGKPDSQPKSRVWKASALRQLGELEAEVVRLGKNLELKY